MIVATAAPFTMTPAKQVIIDLLMRRLSAALPLVAEHSIRVAARAGAFAAEVGGLNVALIETAAAVHDIGKLAMVDLVNKPGALSASEWRVMRTHPAESVRLLKPYPQLSAVLPIVLAHHEQVGGGGYPLGLRGEEIPVEARVLSIVDVFDALSEMRPYRPAREFREVLRTLREMASSGQLDPNFTSLFIRWAEGPTKKSPS